MAKTPSTTGSARGEGRLKTRAEGLKALHTFSIVGAASKMSSSRGVLERTAGKLHTKRTPVTLSAFRKDKDLSVYLNAFVFWRSGEANTSKTVTLSVTLDLVMLVFHFP